MGRCAVSEYSKCPPAFFRSVLVKAVDNKVYVCSLLFIQTVIFGLGKYIMCTIR